MLVAPNLVALPAVGLLLLGMGTVSATPRSAGLVARQGANPTDPWVTVDEEGIPKTVTPVLTTISGTPTLLSAPPPDLTATLFTKHPNSILTTSTGPAEPVPTNDNGTAAFPPCSNTDGEFKPFCRPKHNDVYHPDTTHYITWDTSIFSAPNSTTVKIIGFYVFNDTVIPTTGPPSGEEEAFSSDDLPAGWGFYQWRVERSLLTTPSLSAANVTLRMVALSHSGDGSSGDGSSSSSAGTARWFAGPTVTVRYRPAPPPRPARKAKTPADTAALYVALPLVFGFAALVIAGTFFWNRQARGALGAGGSIMGRGGARGRRLGGGGGGRRKAAAAGLRVGVGPSKKDRARNQEQAIRLMDRDGAGSDAEEEAWEEG
ncbi:f381ca63-ea10-4bda-8231-ca288ce67272 [Thermothielavioides terrestris]|nr:f381ca63-ea10-4bda-8231-ca288ce67272 [Thermothielavioides terrestris]